MGLEELVSSISERFRTVYNGTFELHPRIAEISRPHLINVFWASIRRLPALSNVEVLDLFSAGIMTADGLKTDLMLTYDKGFINIDQKSEYRPSNILTNRPRQ